MRSGILNTVNKSARGEECKQREGARGGEVKKYAASL